ncbi:MAG: hypothetical protein FWC61_03195 [Proteobacteria bacterium]|nr:hypothetical protein [Pseudomonadota bacterium]
MKKKWIYVLLVLAAAGAVGWRVYRIAEESRRQVFNAARAAATDGAPVEAIVAKSGTGTLREPLFVKNGKAFVSASRVNKFKIGQKLGRGYVTSVSRIIDLDTGLYAVKTSGPDGENFVEMEYDGVFVPAGIINSDREPGTGGRNYIFVAKDGVAAMRDVRVIAADADAAVIAGIDDGEVIILSKVADGEKVKIGR